MRAALGLIASLALGACATTPGACDPSRADFFSGISCESSGAFGTRNVQLQSNLNAARSNLQSERSRANAASIDAGAAQAEQRQAADRLAGVRQQNAVLRTRLDAASRNAGADRAVIARQRGELNRLESDRAAAQRNGAGPEQVRELERRQRALLDALGG